MRHIILHHHFFKNAGSSLDFALSRQFGDGFASLHDASGWVSNEQMAMFLNRSPGIRAVSSHHTLAQNFSVPGVWFFNFALVRRPLPRLISTYRFLQRSDGPLSDLAQGTSFREFVRALIEHYPNMVDSPQVMAFARNGFYSRPTSDADLAIARARYAEFSLCAPVERFDEAMVTVEYFNSLVFLPKGLDLAYVPQNVGPIGAEFDDFEKMLGPELFEWLSSRLARDEALWNFANAELDRRVSATPDFAAKLVAFKERCAALVRVPPAPVALSEASDQEVGGPA